MVEQQIPPWMKVKQEQRQQGTPMQPPLQQPQSSQMPPMYPRGNPPFVQQVPPPMAGYHAVPPQQPPFMQQQPQLPPGVRPAPVVGTKMLPSKKKSVLFWVMFTIFFLTLVGTIATGVYYYITYVR